MKKGRPFRRGEAGEKALLLAFVILLVVAFLKHFFLQHN